LTASITMNYISLRFCCKKYRCVFNHFT